MSDRPHSGHELTACDCISQLPQTRRTQPQRAVTPVTPVTPGCVDVPRHTQSQRAVTPVTPGAWTSLAAFLAFPCFPTLTVNARLLVRLSPSR